MRYFFDFDRTIFDTPSFKKVLSQRPTVKQLLQQLKEVFQELGNPSNNGSKRRAFGEALATFLSTGRFLFVPQELQKYLYPEVPEFLYKHGEECTVVTYGVQAFIMAKVSNALTDLPLENIVYTSRRKGRTIRRLCADQEGPFIFVDDAHFQLESVAKWCPNVSIYEMRRDSRPGDGRWPVIHSLDELPQA